MAARGDEPPVDVDPPRVRLRSRVNEYGGGAFWCGDGHVDWVDDATQRIHRAGFVAGAAVAQPLPRPLTAYPPARHAWRYASGCSVRDGAWIVAEREAHTDAAGAPHAEPRNELVAVRAADGRQRVLVGARQEGGGDFVAAPTVSPDGELVAWLRWDHPDMPWDAAELWVGRLELGPANAAAVLDRRRVAGGVHGGAAHGLDRAVSVCLPSWSPDGRLWWCDDADGWWHLRAVPVAGLPAPGAGDDPSTAVPGGGEPGEEVGEPRWVAGGRRYAFCGNGSVVMAVASGGLDSLWLLDPVTGERSAMPGPQLRAVELVAAEGDTVAVVGGTPHRPTTVWRYRLDGGGDEPVELRPVTPPLEPAWVALPEPVTFPTGRAALAQPGADSAEPAADGPVAHALVYLPANGDHIGPPDELPPLVVRIHGGPTAAARPEFSTSVQFWTTRGIAVADVNYRGSTGFGRDYRDQLRGAWGVADVEDCIALTRELSRRGLVDGRRCVIRGGSAGGFTALAAVCFQADWGAEGAFAAACSLYGVTDLAALAADTHKFESRYLDGLVAPLPEGAETYRQRSPLFHADRLATPVLLLQGSEDKVVPPAQAEVLVAALEANGVPHRYVLFSGEGHGFHLAETIVRALSEELSFYGEVLGFEPG
jgi:dipeptidyl aminopeptidase/acylaminoacyl peptidase